jgi:endonuclease YncB( thermonuclease family)
MHSRALLLAVLVGATSASAQPAHRHGQAHSLDGDTLVVDGHRIRLYGIDAPETGQLCSDGWPAGVEAPSSPRSAAGRRAGFLRAQDL